MRLSKYNRKGMRCVILVGVVLLTQLNTSRAGIPSPHSNTKNSDGPAELPREYVKSSLKDTPAGGKAWTVRSGQNPQQVLASASCGDVIQLEAGATFRGHFVFPAKKCDDSHWIVVRSSAADSRLPPEGTRLTPCYAGVSSLNGRPRVACAATDNVLAKFESDEKRGTGPIAFSSGANHYRLIGLEVTRPESSGTVYNLIQFEGAADHLVFDRLWLHGTAQDETVRGILLDGSRYVAIVDSFFTDFHCTSVSGTCSDSQAIAGMGMGPMGPYKISNNFLEASGENIIFGGGTATGSPADIEVSRNHMFKPSIWMKGQPGYVGGKNGNPFITKNIFELKNAQRVLLEGNILENSWGGFTQVGFAILLTPKNQSGSLGTNLCPICQVTDVTIRYNYVRHVAAGLQIANVLSDNKGVPLDGQRYSIHDLVIDDIDGMKYGGPSEFAQLLTSTGAPTLQNVTIDHITAFPSKTMLLIGAFKTPMKNFVFTNSIVSAATYPIWTTGGGKNNCAYNNKPLDSLNACFSPYSFEHNAVIGVPSAYPPGLWPKGNFFPASADKIQFANYSNGKGGDYRLLSSSPYKGKGTDGKDLGADLAAINAAIAGVE